MKVLIINSYATVGSTGNIVALIAGFLGRRGHEVLVCYGKKVEEDLPSNYRLVSNSLENRVAWRLSRLLGYHGRFNKISTFNTIKQIRLFKPDIVQLFNLHANYVDDIYLLSFLKKYGVPVVYTMLDEYAYMGKCCYSYDCVKFKTECKCCPYTRDYPPSLFFDRSSYYFRSKMKVYDNFNNLYFLGCDFVYRRSKESALLKDKDVRIIQEPIDFDNTYYPRDTTSLKEKFGIPKEDKVVLTVTNLKDPRKGGKFFLDLYSKMQQYEGYTFVYVGFNDPNVKKPAGMITVPFVENKDELCEYYSLADVFVFTSLADSSPNTVLQALGCGSPVCCFNIEGVSSIKVRDSNIMCLSPVGDINELMENVKSKQQKDKIIIDKCRESVYTEYSINTVAHNYELLYSSILKKANKCNDKITSYKQKPI